MQANNLNFSVADASENYFILILAIMIVCYIASIIFVRHRVSAVTTDLLVN